MVASCLKNVNNPERPKQKSSAKDGMAGGGLLPHDSCGMSTDGGSDTIMTEATKRTLKRVVDIVIAVLTALITTISAHAAGIVR